MSYPGNNIPGWMDKEELTWLYEQAQVMTSIVEIGSWHGRSTHALLSGCRGHVVSVDNWDAELMKPYRDAGAARKSFFDNTKEFTNLAVLEMGSLHAVEAFEDASVDMVFIDADHRHEAVKADILSWLPKARKLLCGHDYGANWPGVDRAVNEIFGDKAKSIGAIWYVNLGS